MKKIEQALRSAIEALEMASEDAKEWATQYVTSDNAPTTVRQYVADKAEPALNQLKSALSEIGECEPVAEALHERNRLGYAVVDVIGTLDEIIENAQEVEVDDFLHIAIPIDKWHELQDALEDMPKRADLYTSPKPIEKCEPVGELILDPVFLPALKAPLVNWKINLVDLEVGTKFYTSPQPRDWVELSDNFIAETIWENTKLNPNIKDDAETLLYVTNAIKAILSESKQLNTKG